MKKLADALKRLGMDLEKLKQSVMKHEGLRLSPYRDTTGNITIGYGTNLSQGITQDEAAYLFNSRLLIAIKQAQMQPWWQYVAGNDVRERAMSEIVYNVGSDGVASFHNALAAMANGDWAACAAGFLDSLWHKQVGKRAEVLAKMISTGQDPS